MVEVMSLDWIRSLPPCSVTFALAPPGWLLSAVISVPTLSPGAAMHWVALSRAPSPTTTPLWSPRPANVSTPGPEPTWRAQDARAGLGGRPGPSREAEDAGGAR